jgi:hypothetical protein
MCRRGEGAGSTACPAWRLPGHGIATREDPSEIHDRFDDGSLAGARAELLWRMAQEMAILGPDMLLPARMA